MCTLVILRRSGHDWPVLIAANRDEMLDRPWRPPGRHWPDRAQVTAGQDKLAGGTWLGINDDGVCAGILNRTGALGPAAGKRSRGELVLEALDHADAAAAGALADIDGAAYRPFNLVVADPEEAFWLRHDGDGAPVFRPLPEGLSMFTARERNDSESARIRTHLSDFEAAAPPDPARGAWQSWAALLARGRADSGGDPEAAMCIEPQAGFGTVNASLIALPRQGRPGTAPVWLFAAGPPDRHAFEGVEI